MVGACADLLTCRETELSYRWDWGGHYDDDSHAPYYYN
jgi:hypothetical protein